MIAARWASILAPSEVVYDSDWAERPILLSSHNLVEFMKILLCNTTKRGSGRAKRTSLWQVLGLARSIGRQVGIVFFVKTR